MDTNRYSYSLHCNAYARYPSDSHPFFDKAYVENWKAAVNVLSKASYVQDNSKVNIYIDWSNAQDVTERALQELSLESSVPSLDTQELPEDIFKNGLIKKLWDNRYKVETPCIVEMPKHLSGQPYHYLELFLHDFFLCMNLSCPGSCDFGNAYFTTKTGEHHPIGLAGETFEFVWHEDITNNWNLIEHIPVAEVVAWHRSLNIGPRQVATTKAEQSLFALLHLSKSTGGITDLMWTSHSLEVLYDTPAALITKSLQDRVCSVLNIPTEQEKQVRKRLREFYDARSSFVHGSMMTSHPLGNDFLDRDALIPINSLLHDLDFGILIWLATLQTFVKNNWKEVIFSESHQGIPVN